MKTRKQKRKQVQQRAFSDVYDAENTTSAKTERLKNKKHNATIIICPLGPIVDYGILLCAQAINLPPSMKHKQAAWFRVCCSLSYRVSVQGCGALIGHGSGSTFILSWRPTADNSRQVDSPHSCWVVIEASD